MNRMFLPTYAPMNFKIKDVESSNKYSSFQVLDLPNFLNTTGDTGNLAYSSNAIYYRATQGWSPLWSSTNVNTDANITVIENNGNVNISLTPSFPIGGNVINNGPSGNLSVAIFDGSVGRTIKSTQVSISNDTNISTSGNIQTSRLISSSITNSGNIQTVGLNSDVINNTGTVQTTFLTSTNINSSGTILSNNFSGNTISVTTGQLNTIRTARVEGITSTIDCSNVILGNVRIIGSEIALTPTLTIFDSSGGPLSPQPPRGGGALRLKRFGTIVHALVEAINFNDPGVTSTFQYAIATYVLPPIYAPEFPVNVANPFGGPTAFTNGKPGTWIGTIYFRDGGAITQTRSTVVYYEASTSELVFVYGADARLGRPGNALLQAHSFVYRLPDTSSQFPLPV